MRHIGLILLFILVGVGFQTAMNTERHYGLAYTRHRYATTERDLKFISDCLRSYNKAHGHYPTNDAGLLSVPKLVKELKAKDKYGWHPRHRTIILSESGLLGVWGEPYIYENRRGLNKNCFPGSGALDGNKSYSIKVADGVYLWSLGAKQNYEEYIRLEHIFTTVYLALALIALLGIVWFCSGEWRAIAKGKNGLGRIFRFSGSIAAGIAAALFACFFAFTFSIRTCYAWGVNMRRTPELTRDYTTLMRKYRDCGVIKDETFKKLIEALKKKEPDERYF